MQVDPRSMRPDHVGKGFQTPADDPGAAPSTRTLDPIANAWRDRDPLAKPQRFEMRLGFHRTTTPTT